MKQVIKFFLFCLVFWLAGCGDEINSLGVSIEVVYEFYI